MALGLKESNLFCPTRAQVLRCAPQSMDAQRHTPGHQLLGMSLQLKVLLWFQAQRSSRKVVQPALPPGSFSSYCNTELHMDKHMTQGLTPVFIFHSHLPSQNQDINYPELYFPFCLFPYEKRSPFSADFKGRIPGILLWHLALWMPPHLIQGFLPQAPGFHKLALENPPHALGKPHLQLINFAVLISSLKSPSLTFQQWDAIALLVG